MFQVTNIVGSTDTSEASEMISDAISALHQEYEPTAVAEIVVLELYEYLLEVLDLDFEAADAALAQAAVTLATQKVPIGQELTSNLWLQ